ncbi:hypothetical protein PUN28_002643 [Cardiocondyla obscurior]|uniref:Uncharacterized protein n=1 Tax=Cardiocondyla obscurior TaxID=286306 RepID=A0AAW2GVI7_9HYME
MNFLLKFFLFCEQCPVYHEPRRVVSSSNWKKEAPGQFYSSSFFSKNVTFLVRIVHRIIRHFSLAKENHCT